MMKSAIIDELARHAADVAKRSHAPYSGRQEGVVLILDDGTLVAGARVESASFSLVIPAATNALSTLASSGRDDVTALVASTPFTAHDHAMLSQTFAGTFRLSGDALMLRRGISSLPTLTSWLDPTVPRPSSGIDAAREIAQRAVVPESDFPVGCIAVTKEGIAVPGVNVEHEDWARVICAERNALGTLITYGLGTAASLYLTCLKDASGTPCGACRQLLAELAPEAEILMDRGNGEPLASSPLDLLPGAFAGSAIPPRPH
jgi:cytidine deaminase